MSDANLKPAPGELKDITKPLLEGLASPQDSDKDSNGVNIPDAAGGNNDDAMSGFTQADYRNLQNFKTENQSKLDSFLNFF